MPLLSDLGAAAQGFLEGYTSGRQFRYERQMKEEAHQIDKIRVQLALDASRRDAEEVLQKKQLQERADAIIKQMAVLDNYAAIQVTKNKTINPELFLTMMNLSTEAASIGRADLSVAIREAAKGVYTEPAPRKNELAEQIKNIEEVKHRKLTDEEIDILSGLRTKGKEDKTETDVMSDVSDIRPFLDILAKQGVTTDKIPSALAPVVKETFHNYVKSVRGSDKRLEAKLPTQTSIPGSIVPTIPAHQPQVVPSIPAIQSTPTAPITEPSPQDEETDVKTKILDLHKGGKPFPTFKVGQQYFQDARSRGHLDQNNYVKVYRLLQTNYPDTTK